MKDWGLLGVVLDLAIAVSGTLVVFWLVGVFWMTAQQALRSWWPELALVGALAVSISLSRSRGRG